MRPAVLACGWLLAADAFLLVDAALERRAPAAELRFDERAFPLSDYGRDNTALRLRPQWRETALWLTAGKLAEFGLDPRSRARKQVLAVVNRQGEVVGAGLDPARLGELYPDRTAYAFTPAVITVSGTASATPAAIHVLTRSVHVPAHLRGVFDRLDPARIPLTAPRYEVSVCFGPSGRMWLCGARALP